KRDGDAARKFQILSSKFQIKTRAQTARERPAPALPKPGIHPRSGSSSCQRPMKILPAVFALTTFPAFSQAPEWEDPAVFRVNKEAPRATAMPFPEREAALGGKRLESP